MATSNATTTNRTDRHQRIDDKLGGNGHLAHRVTTARRAGQSWRVIAAAITADTGITVTDKNLWDWFGPHADQTPTSGGDAA